MENKCQLKKASNFDIPELIEIEKSAAGSKLYSPMLTEDEWLVALEIGSVYLIERDGITVGSVSYENKNGVAQITGLVVSPEFQNQGIGRQVLTQIFEELKGMHRIELATHPENARALKLYQSFGFTVESRKENYYGDGEPRLILVLQNDIPKT